MIDAGASRDVRAPARKPVAGGQPVPSAPAEAGVSIGVPAARGPLAPDGLGPLLARAVAQRAEDAGDTSAHAPAAVLLQRSPRAWTREATTKTVAALTAGWGLSSRWPAVQVLVARYGQLPEAGLEQREAVLGDIEHAMARWRSNQRESTGLKTDLDLSKRTALEALATQIARERAEIVADKARIAERAAASKARSAAPQAARPVAPAALPLLDAVAEPPAAPHVPAAVELGLPVATSEQPDAPGDPAGATERAIGDFIPEELRPWAGFGPSAMDLDWHVLIVDAHNSGDRARMADVEARVVAAGLEYSYQLPSNLHLTPTIDHPLLRAVAPDVPGFTEAELEAIDVKFRRKIYAAEQSADPAVVRSLDRELEQAGLEDRYQRPGYPSAVSGRSSTGVVHPSGWVLLDESVRNDDLGRVHPDADRPIRGFPAAKSVSVDGYFRRKIRAAAAGSEATRRELDAELTDAGFEHRYIRDVDHLDREASIRGEIGAVMTMLLITGQALIPGFSPMDSARVDGHFRRRIRESVRSGDDALKLAIDAELIDQGLELRYIRGFGSPGRGQGTGEHRYLNMEGSPHRAPAELSNPAGGDQAPPVWGRSEPGAVHVDEARRPIAGLSPQESAKLDGYFAREIRKATRTENLEEREKQLADIDADLIRRGIEHRYIRAADADGKPLYYVNEPAEGYRVGNVRDPLGQPALIPGLSAQRSAETDVYFRREIRKAVKSGNPAHVNHVTAQLSAAGLADRYAWD